MRILIAPDSFKGALSAFAAAEAMRRGAARACASARIDVCPLSDGGEGFLEVSSSLLGGTTRHVRVTGPTGSPVDARLLFLPDGATAVIETALAVGLGVLGGSPRHATRTTTFGVGQLIREALDCQARTIIVGLGGSATTDGGAGMAQALGVRFESAHLDGTAVERSSGKASGVEFGDTEAAAKPILGGDLTRVTRIDLGSRDQRLESIELVALADVDNPLTGSEGAAFGYAPQKGASEHEARELDAALRHLATLAGDVGDHAGDGAAGGLGYGLRVFAGAEQQSGTDFVLTAARFDERLRDCDLVLTGEGGLDEQSLRGKVVSGVSRRCRAAGVPAIALVGAIGPEAESLLDQGLTAFFSLCDRPMTTADAINQAAPLLESLAENVVRMHRASWSVSLGRETRGRSGFGPTGQ